MSDPMSDPVSVRKTKGNYVLPNILASALNGISVRTQFEASILSICFIVLGLLFTAIYVPFFMDVSMIIKVMTFVNSAAGFVFLTSMLATQYQQYRSYLGVAGLLEEDEVDKE